MKLRDYQLKILDEILQREESAIDWHGGSGFNVIIAYLLQKGFRLHYDKINSIRCKHLLKAYKINNKKYKNTEANIHIFNKGHFTYIRIT